MNVAADFSGRVMKVTASVLKMLTIIREHTAEMELVIRTPPQFVALVTGGAIDDASFRSLRAELGVALAAPEDPHPGF
jgi:hypothetical protein